MNKPTLDAYNWRVPITHENPLSAPQSTQAFPITEFKQVIVTNLWAQQRVDTWMIWEVLSVDAEGNGLQHMRFIAQSFTQTAALNSARDYVWTVYRKDIANGDIPF